MEKLRQTGNEFIDEATRQLADHPRAAQILRVLRRKIHCALYPLYTTQRDPGLSFSYMIDRYALSRSTIEELREWMHQEEKRSA